MENEPDTAGEQEVEQHTGVSREENNEPEKRNVLLFYVLFATVR